MVRELKRQGKTYYLCPVCKLVYLERKWAQECQDFCAQYKGCSLEITSHAVPYPVREHPLRKE